MGPCRRRGQLIWEGPLHRQNQQTGFKDLTGRCRGRACRCRCHCRKRTRTAGAKRSSHSRPPPPPLPLPPPLPPLPAGQEPSSLRTQAVRGADVALPSLRSTALRSRSNRERAASAYWIQPFNGTLSKAGDKLAQAGATDLGGAPPQAESADWIQGFDGTLPRACLPLPRPLSQADKDGWGQEEQPQQTAASSASTAAAAATAASAAAAAAASATASAASRAGAIFVEDAGSQGAPTSRCRH